MNRRLSIYYWTAACIFLLANEACIKDGPAKDDVGDIRFINQSDQNLGIYFSNNLPDTTIVDLNNCGCSNVQPFSKDNFCASLRGWKGHIAKMCPSGKIMLVALNNDTIDKYGISDVVSNYRIVKRYELSIDSLEKLNWTIVYP